MEEPKTLVHMLEATCRLYPSRIALIQDNRRMTYGDLYRAASSVAKAMARRGVVKGDRVMIALPNVPEFVIAYFAAVKLGAVAVTVNIAYTSHELLHLIQNSGAKAFITTPSVVKKFLDIRQEASHCAVLIVTEGTAGLSMADIIAGEPVEFSGPALEGDDPAVMIYTAGLTGRPLGAVLTHGNLCTQALLFESICQGRHDDIGLAVIPLFHAFGAATNMLGPLSLGASVVMMETFSVDGIFRAIEKEKITYISAVPRLYLAMFMHQGAETRDVSSLRLCMTGGASIPTEFISMFREKFNVKLAEGYGLTEASPVVSFSRLEMTQKPGSVGTPAPGVDVKVVDDDGSELPAGQVGELIVRGPNVMKGYFNEPEATAEVLKGEWLFTGDLARLDDEGYIFLAGLKKRLIITSGFNVYPAEVESILLRHPAVKEAKVVGSPDFMRGEIVKAIVVKREGFSLDDTELIRYCRTYLAPFKTPREVEFVPSIP